MKDGARVTCSESGSNGVCLLLASIKVPNANAFMSPAQLKGTYESESVLKHKGRPRSLFHTLVSVKSIAFILWPCFC